MKETEAITESTFVLPPAPAPSEAGAGDESCFVMGGGPEDAPPARPEAEELAARLVRELNAFADEGAAEAVGSDGPLTRPSGTLSPLPRGEVGRPSPSPLRGEGARRADEGARAALCGVGSPDNGPDPVESLGPADVSRFEAPGFAAPSGPSGPGELSRFEATGFAAGGLTAETTPAGPEDPDSTARLTTARGVPGGFPTVGETVGDYRLLAALGRGVRGAVFLADQPNLAHRVVVLKVTPRDGREHLSLATLRHPHIVPLYCAQDVVDRDLRLLCMPYLGGAPLARIGAAMEGIRPARRRGRDIVDVLDRAQAEAPLAPPDRGAARASLARASYAQAIAWIGACLADALHDAHRHGLVHLDLKPSNILLAADGTPMLLDFHLAQPPIRPDDPTPRWLGGTPHYMAPEQRIAMAEIHARRPITVAVDGRSDLYALGLVLYQMLGGRISIGPYPMDRVPFRRPPGVPVGLADILARCLAFDPRDRYPDAGQLADDLRRHLADRPLLGVRNRGLAERCRKWSRRHPAAVARAGRLAAMLALLLAGGLAATLDARHRLRGAESLLAEARQQMARRADPAAALAAKQGLALIEGSWMAALGRPPARARELRRDLEAELARAHRNRSAEDLHDLADRLRWLYGTDLAPTDALRALERRLRDTWESGGRLLDRLGDGLDDRRVARLRTDFLDLGLLGADLRVWLARGDARAEARRQALRTLDEAERRFGPGPVLARERQTQAEALGLTDVAAAAARLLAEHPPRTAWEHYALGRSLLAAGDLEAAARAFDRATELEPQDLWAQFSRGLCAYRRRQYETALGAFEICVALSPRTAECYYNRGLAHAAMGRADLARRDRDHARRLAPDLAPAPPRDDLVYDGPDP